ncbi:leucine-rich repeat-containing protein 71 isoform X2 [Electrophorus electricus]|uniref:leucine-rich repeat-containing protein 71 isoform X2 n=1 Tax=Electrophorus electricus TaxID=8005 RepID=UPI0015D08A64|nr:leucine-rich repeat-containing protein 71 isoform X2 [Electrophorus electricus]
MKKRSEKVSKEKGSSGFEEEITKIGGLNLQDKGSVQTTDDYQCSGILELDFPELCALAGVSEIPTVKLRQPTAASPSPSTDRGAMEGSPTQISSGSPVTTWCREPYLQIEKENGDSRTVKKVRVSGWMVDEVMARVLSKILPSLSNLQSLEMWRARLTDRTLTSLKNTITLCSNLRTVILDGNPIPGQAYYILLGEDSLVTHLSLRNNRIEEEGARLIGSALSTVHSTNRNLLSLNMAFNSIGDAGAIHIAQGLRLNRSLLCLSLANNHVGDSGAAHLAEVLGPFALTHEEIVERRRQLIMRDQLVPSQGVGTDSTGEHPLSIPSNSSIECNTSKVSKSSSKKKDAPKRDEKPAAGQTGATAAKKEEHKMTKKASDTKIARGRGGKSGGKDKHPSVTEQEEKSSSVQKSEEVVETLSPLLDPDVRHVEGKVIHPGNTALISLNLSGNKLTKQSLHMFLSLVGGQGEGGLLRLSLNRNNFPLDCEAFLNIQAMMSLKAPLIKAGSGQVDDEEGQAA